MGKYASHCVYRIRFESHSHAADRGGALPVCRTFSLAAWSIGSRELCQLRTQLTGSQSRTARKDPLIGSGGGLLRYLRMSR